ncbi:MAG TPA: hypothetical protein VM911_18995 [Pyrinomonadaceae bacterium]|jgi:hypothetical protein|nr:hypothetical protein [Pyrinomonadaceae bacterium]
MTFADLFETLSWKPIRNCPGRYVLQGANSTWLRVEELTGREIKVSAHRVSAARDLVLVAALDGGGGIISYQREDGTLLHTLNTPEGFQRKLQQLGIKLAEQDRFVA